VLVPPRDPAALRAAVERLLADPAERERLGGAARTKARTAFSAAAAADALLAAYAGAL
jgi:glycosyltransferase involved in cell wall biosynthesis